MADSNRRGRNDSDNDCHHMRTGCYILLRLYENWRKNCCRLCRKNSCAHQKSGNCYGNDLPSCGHRRRLYRVPY